MDEIQKAIAAVKANPPLNPLPWREDDSVVRSANSNAVAQWAEWADAAHIAAAVNAVPLLIAEVERLQAELDKLKALAELVEKQAVLPPHSEFCACFDWHPVSGRRACDCDYAERNAARIEARRALGLEPMPAPPEPQAEPGVPNV